MIRVLLVDDHRVVRQGIRQMLADAPDIEVAAEAADGIEAMAGIRQHMVCAPGLHVVLLDIALPGLDGLDVLKRSKAEFPDLAVLMLSTYPDSQFAVRCLRAGASGYLNKTADPDDMVAAIRQVAKGRRYVTPTVADLLANSLSEGAERAPHETLSQREHQVFCLLAQGHSVGQIAESLHLSPNTVSTYRARILEKTGVRNDVELALYAVRQQLVQV